jgi:hypothetical protein
MAHHQLLLSNCRPKILYRFRQVKVRVISRPAVVRHGVRHPSVTRNQFFFKLFLDGYGFVDIGRPVWQEVGSVVTVVTGSLQLSSSGLSPAVLMTIFYYLNFETPPVWRAKFLYLFSPGIWHASGHGWSPWCSLGSDRTETSNIAVSDSRVCVYWGFHYCCMELVPWYVSVAYQQLLYRRLFRDRCLVMDLYLIMLLRV